MGKNEFKKKKFRFSGKKIGSDTEGTEIGPWLRFPIPKPGFGSRLMPRKSERPQSQKSVIYSIHLGSN